MLIIMFKGKFFLMKKLIMFILIVVLIIILLPVKKVEAFSLVEPYLTNETKICFYTSGNVALENTETIVIKNGNAVIVEGSLENYQIIKSKIIHISGESYCFNCGAEKFEEITNKLCGKILKSEKLNNEIIVVYGYNKNLQGGIKLNEGLVNVQLAFRSGIATVGMPLILGSI